MKKIFLFTFIYLFGLSIKSQNLDSLFEAWQDPSNQDSLRVNAYVAYMRDAYLYSNPDTIEKLSEALHDFAKERNYPGAVGAGYIMQGNANFLKGNYPKALHYYEKSLAIREKLGDIAGMSGLLNNIGNIYNHKGNLPKALDYYQRALISMEKIGARSNMAFTLDNIGSIYSFQGNTRKAIEYYNRALAIEEEIGTKSSIASILNNLGAAYNKDGDPDRALQNYFKSLRLWEEVGDKYNIGGGVNNIGMIYKLQGNYPLAMEYCQRSLDIRKEVGDKRGIPRSLTAIGEIHQKMGRNDLALSHCKEALKLAEELGTLDRQKFACECLYNTYKAMGKGTEALVYLEKANVINDSLQMMETTKKLEQMEFAKVMLQDSITKAEEVRLVEEAHQAEVRQKNKTRNILIGSSLFLLLLAGGLYSRWQYVRRSREIIAKERDRSDNLLLNILPEEIAAELKERGRADARDFDKVSILFTDFKGFTEYSSKLSAIDLVNEINHCFKAFDTIIEKHGIEKIKTIGDAYMAAGGLPLPSDDSVKNTVLAALEMQDFIIKRKAEKEALGELGFEMRVGIHTGAVVAGIVGVKKFQYDIWGDTVNTASRMESHGAADKVNISEATYELLKNDMQFAFEKREKIEVKGKGEMEMYFVDKA